VNSRVIDDILAGIELVEGLLSHLTAAKQVAEQGGDLTPDQRSALDAANAVRKNRLLAAIDARIGPDDSLPAVTNDPLADDKDKVAVLAAEVARLRDANQALANQLAAEQAGVTAVGTPGVIAEGEDVANGGPNVDPAELPPAPGPIEP
jgi:hypothetical protein